MSSVLWYFWFLSGYMSLTCGLLSCSTPQVTILHIKLYIVFHDWPQKGFHSPSLRPPSTLWSVILLSALSKYTMYFLLRYDGRMWQEWVFDQLTVPASPLCYLQLKLETTLLGILSSTLYSLHHVLECCEMWMLSHNYL